MNRDPTTLRKAIDSIDELIVLESQKVETLRKLKQCLLVFELVPDVAQDGVKCTTVEDHNYGGLGIKRICNLTLRVHLKDGSERTFPMTEVDEALWPEGTVLPRKNR